MPKYDRAGRALNNTMVFVAASQTTKQISVSGDACPNNDYLERVIITHATTATGTVNVLDGTTSILLHAIGAYGTAANSAPLVFAYDINATATSTKGFNITTGSSVTCVAIGRFGDVLP